MTQRPARRRGSLGDVAVLHSSRRSKERTGSEFDTFGAEAIFCFGSAKAHRGHGNRLVVQANAKSGFDSIGLDPALDEPQWVRTAFRKRLGRGMVDLVLRGAVALRDADGELAQNRIHERSGGTFASALDKFNALIDRSAGGNASEPTELINREAKCGENFAIQFREWLRRSGFDLRVK